MGGFGIGWLIVGQSPSFMILIMGVGTVSIAASMWHLPAMASLSHHYSHRRATALSFHGVGGNIGDAISPVVTGFLLGFLAWREILSIYAVVPLFIAFLVYWVFKDIGKTSTKNGKTNEVTWSNETRKVLKDPLIWGITLVSGVRGMAFIALITFLPSYFSSDLGMSNLSRGVHFGLLVAVGIVSTPFMGYLSDRIGRKLDLIPGMVFLSITVCLPFFI